MTTEFGIFSEEGCCENGMFSHEEAEARIKAMGEEAEGCFIAECCEEHREEEREHCRECMAEETEEEEG
jgi:hypothetical protein